MQCNTHSTHTSRMTCSTLCRNSCRYQDTHRRNNKFLYLACSIPWILRSISRLWDKTRNRPRWCSKYQRRHCSISSCRKACSANCSTPLQRSFRPCHTFHCPRNTFRLSYRSSIRWCRHTASSPLDNSQTSHYSHILGRRWCLWTGSIPVRQDCSMRRHHMLPLACRSSSRPLYNFGYLYNNHHLDTYLDSY